MPLSRNMTQIDIVNYLKEDLLKSIINDVDTCVQPDKVEGGYFAVPRLVLSYIDYLGALFHGYSGKVKK